MGIAQVILHTYTHIAVHISGKKRKKKSADVGWSWGGIYIHNIHV